MLPDCGHIQEMEVERKNRKLARANGELLTPIYTAEDGLKAIQAFIPVNYRESLLLHPNITAQFYNAGHILGSAYVVLQVTEGQKKSKIVFSGDIGTDDQPYIEDPAVIDRADIVIMETTYGNRIREDKDNRMELLADAINDGFARGGNIIIPAFAVERTQDLLYFLGKLQSDRKIPLLPIYIDSPLAVAATKIFSANTRNFDQEPTALMEKGINPLNLDNLRFSVTTEDSIALNNLTEPAIIISASGMADAGRIKHHLKHNLWRSNATVIFVGYQAEGSLGRRLVDGAPEVTIHGEKVSVNAHIVNLHGFSGHADRNELMKWVKTAGEHARSIVLVHGEKSSIHAFAQAVEQELGKVPVIPVLGEQIEFRQDEIIRIKPEVPWLKETESKCALAAGEGEPLAGGLKKTVWSARGLSPAEVDDKYRNLRDRLHKIVQTARKEKDYAYLTEIFERLEQILKESFYK
jgi:metallo-beta-lactamase family protein